MKLQISPAQLNELSKKGKKKLRKWWKPKEGDWFISKDAGYDIVRNWPYIDDENRIESSEWDGIGGYCDFYLEDCLPLLSISQMIEFLDENISYGVQKSFVTNKLVFNLMFDVSKPYHDSPSSDTLCDDLWEACREILEK